MARDLFHPIVRTEYSNRILYLAIPLVVYNNFFRLPLIKTVVSENHLKLIVYDVDKEEIEQWIN